MSKYVIGITGGIGCGKSTVLKTLKEKYSAEIIEADKVAHQLMQPGKASYNAIIKEFGTAILEKDKSIDRKALGDVVFSSNIKRKLLNEITHPLVKAEITELIDKSSSKIIAVEAALFIEAGYIDICQELWYIYTDKEKRIMRLTSSRGMNRDKIESIMSAQLSDDEFRRYADVVIDNSGTSQDTIKQIDAIIKKHIEGNEEKNG